MKLWTIWVQSDDGHTWLEDAWDDESTAENYAGYKQAVEDAERVAKVNGSAMRVLAVELPDEAVFGMFAPPTTVATSTESVE